LSRRIVAVGGVGRMTIFILGGLPEEELIAEVD
jgi:hypothetical protein